MTAPIAINLDDLTQEHIDRALANPGSCAYSGPCILGALMSEEEIAYLNEVKADSSSIGALVTDGLVSLPEHQLDKAREIQRDFDKLGYRNGSLRMGGLLGLRHNLPQFSWPEDVPCG